MRTLISAAFLAALLTPAFTGLAAAADLDYYEPRPAPVLLPPPPPPPCGVYRPCVRPYRFGYVGPRFRRFGFAPPPWHMGYPPRPRPFVEERFAYGPHGGPDEPRGYNHGYDPSERYSHRDRYEREEHSYRRHEERYGYDRRDDERFERGPRPDFRGDRDPYDRG